VGSGYSPWSFLANKAMDPSGTDQRPTLALMWHTQAQTQPQTNTHSHRRIIKPQATRSDWHGKKPISTVRRGSCQERCSVKRCSQGGFNNDSVCENARSVPEWLFGRQSMRYCTIGCRLSCQVRLQILPDRMPSWRWSVLAADAKNAGIARELTRLTPKPPSFTARLA